MVVSRPLNGWSMSILLTALLAQTNGATAVPKWSFSASCRSGKYTPTSPASSM